MSLIKGPKGINLQVANVTPDDRGKEYYINISLEMKEYFTSLEMKEYYTILEIKFTYSFKVNSKYFYNTNQNINQVIQCLSSTRYCRLPAHI